jgi:hypothetical protein
MENKKLPRLSFKDRLKVVNGEIKMYEFQLSAGPNKDELWRAFCERKLQKKYKKRDLLLFGKSYSEQLETEPITTNKAIEQWLERNETIETM